MDSFERVFASFKNLPVDRPPVLPHIGDHAGIIQKLTYDVMYKDAKKAAEAHLIALDLYGYDIVTFQVEPSWPVAEACGAEVNYPKNKNPWIVKHLINTEEDIKNLEIPDFMAVQSTRVMIDGTHILAEKSNVPVAAYMTGPLTFSLQLMSYKDLFKNIAKNSDFIHELIIKATKVIEAYIKALKDAGAQILVICEHDVQMISPRLVKKLSLDYMSEILKIYDYNILHICGKVTQHIKINADYLKKLKGLNTINIGPNVDIVSTQKLLNYDVGIAGNIDHLKLLPTGNPNDIKTAVHSAIRKSGGDSRFILAPGCEITSDTPIENVKAFVNAVQTFQH
ncbi:MAG: uroporphyrinogen decarboxylase family protein [Candidatus Hermodarchaeota archaeon]